MKKAVNLKAHIALISCGDSFSIMERNPNAKGIQGITFSIPVTSRIADLLDQSGIVEVQNYTESGTLTFKRRDFYDTTTMVEIIMDILEKHETGKHS